MSSTKYSDLFKNHLKNAFEDLSKELDGIQQERMNIENIIHILQLDIERLKNEANFIKNTLKYISGPEQNSEEYVYIKALEHTQAGVDEKVKDALLQASQRKLKSEKLNIPAQTISSPSLGPNSTAVKRVLEELGKFQSKQDLEKWIHLTYRSINTKFLSQTLKKMRDKGQIVSIKFNNSKHFVYHGLDEWRAGDQIDKERMPEITNENIKMETMELIT